MDGRILRVPFGLTLEFEGWCLSGGELETSTGMLVVVVLEVSLVK